MYFQRIDVPVVSSANKFIIRILGAILFGAQTSLAA
jgi:hypothetical protein